MAQSQCPNYLAVLQAHAASLRRKILEQRSEQDRAEQSRKKAEAEAKFLQEEVRVDEEELSAQRNSLKKQAAQALSDKLEVEACKKEVIDRMLQIESLEVDLRKAEEETAKTVAIGIEKGRASIQRHEEERLAVLAYKRAAVQSEAQAAKQEVHKERTKLEEDIQEAPKHVPRCAAVQLCAAFEFVEQRCAVRSEVNSCAAELAAAEKQRVDRRELFENELADVEKGTENHRCSVAASRRKNEEKAKKRKKDLLKDIDDTRRDIERFEKKIKRAEEKQKRHIRAMAEKTVAMAEQKVEKASTAASLRSAPGYSSSLVKALVKRDSVLEPMMMSNARRGKAGSLHAEFPMVGALQGIEQEIRLAATSHSMPRSTSLPSLT